MISGSRRSADRQRRRVAAGEHPAALAGDADRHHLELVRVERGQDAAGADRGDGVFGAAPAEDDGDCGSFAALLTVGDPTGRAATAPALESRPHAASVRQRGRDVGDEVGGVLDAAGEPDQARAARRRPTGPAGRPWCAGRRRRWPATTSVDALEEPRHRVGRAELERDHARDRGASAARRPRRTDRRAGRASAPTVRPGGRPAAAATRGRVRGLPGQPQVQRGQRAVREPGVEVARDAAGRVAPGPQRGPAAPGRGSPRSRAAGLSGRSAPWCRWPPPGRRRGRAGAGRAGWRWCCRPRPARRPRAPPRPARDVAHVQARVGRGLQQHQPDPVEGGYGPAVGASDRRVTPRGGQRLRGPGPGHVVAVGGQQDRVARAQHGQQSGA